MKLSDIDLLKLQTRYLQNDPVIKGICQALNVQYTQLSSDVILCLIYSRIGSLPEEVVDELAWQFHVDFYDTTDLDLKRELVKNSIKIHKIKGTPYAIEQLVTEVFGYGELKEWFEYSGDPYNFKIAVDYTAGSAANILRFHNLIDSVKNVRSFLEAIELTIREYITIEEKTYMRDVILNTKLGIWHLGAVPFASLGIEVEV